MNRLVYRLLSVMLLLVFLGCQGPIFRQSRTYQIPDTSVLWGEFGRGKLVKLKRDLMISSGVKDGRVLEPDGQVEVADGVYRQLSIETYKANPKQWLQYTLVKGGTLLRCVKLTQVDYISVSKDYKLSAEILDGDLAGITVDLGSLVHTEANSEGLTTLHPNPKYLEIIEQ